MRWVGLVLVGLFVVVAAPGNADEVVGPQIDLRVEQPAYAGMPIWLDVDVHDACLEAIYDGGVTAGVAPFRGFGPFNERAEVQRLDGSVVAGGFRPYLAPHTRLPVERHSCPGTPPKASGASHRFPLHISAWLGAPGSYRVRWVIPTTEGEGVIAQSAWTSFTVLPSSSAQREQWLQHELAHIPANTDEIEKTYIPSLLAAWEDSRVTRRMLDLLCSKDDNVSILSSSAFTDDLDQDGADYLISLVSKGCLSRGLDVYLSEHGVRHDTFRAGMTDAVISRLQNASVPDARRLVEILLWLENGAQDAVAGRADVAVLYVTPKFIADPDIWAKRHVIEYLTYHTNTPGVREVLRTFALQQNRASEMALDALARMGEAEDLPTVSKRLSGPLDGLVLSNLGNVVAELAIIWQKPPAYVAAAMVALHDILAHAQLPEIHDDAALALAKLGDRDGINAVVQTLQGGSKEDIRHLLNNMVGGDVPCPEAQSLCYQFIEPSPDINAPWIMVRREAAIEFFKSKLQK